MGWKGMMLACAGALAVTSIALADTPRNADEQKMIDQAKAMYASRGLPFTQADEDSLLQRVRQLQGRAIQAAVLAQNGAMSGGEALAMTAAPAAAVPAPLPAVSSGSLADLIRERQASKAPSTFERKPDGFVANGRLVVDPSGTIAQFAGDASTGDVTYFVEQGQGVYLVRFNNVNSTLAPVTVGQVSLMGGARFTGVDGQSVAGEDILPMGRGLIVSRQGNLFVNTFGGAVEAQSIPAGFSIAPMQHGDVAGTGYVLLRKTAQTSSQEQSNPFKAIGSLVKDVSGHSDAKDYAFLNVKTGRVVYLNRSLQSDQVGQGTGCAGKGLVHKCSGWQQQESIYETDGMPNFGHYYWAVQWMMTAEGPTAVVMENGVREVNVIRLDTGTRANAFQRGLGITGFIVQPTADGSIGITGKWMFKDHVVADVRTLFTASASPAPAEEASPAT